jgi:hypothetical protein
MDREVAERVARIEHGHERLTEALAHLTGRVDMLTVQVASVTTLVSQVESQVSRLVATVMHGFTRAAERDRAQTEHLSSIDRRLDELETILAESPRP